MLKPGHAPAQGLQVRPRSLPPHTQGSTPSLFSCTPLSVALCACVLLATLCLAISFHTPMPPSLFRFMRSSLRHKRLKAMDACKIMLGCLLAGKEETPNSSRDDENEEDEEEQVELSRELTGPRSQGISPMLAANIASYMVAPDTAVVAVSRYALETVDSVGDSITEGYALLQPSSSQVRFSGVQTTERHVLVSTEAGISVLRPNVLRGSGGSASKDGSLVVAELPLPHHSEQIHCFTCSPDGAYVAMGCGSANVSVYHCAFCGAEDEGEWDPICSLPSDAPRRRESSPSLLKSSMHLLYEFVGHTDCVKHLQLTVKNAPRKVPAAARGPPLLLYSAGDDGVICLWDLETGVLRSCVRYEPHGLGVLEVSYHSGLVAIASNKPMLVVYRPAAEPTPGAETDRAPQSESGNFVVRTYRITSSGDPSTGSPLAYDSQEVRQECPRLQLATVTLITGAHNRTPTAAKFTEDSQWIASAGEDEVLSICSIAEPRRQFQCLEGLTRRNCFTLFNVLLSVCVLASPPLSSVIIVLACTSDGTLLQWVVDPRDGRCNYTKKLQLNVGGLLAVGVQKPMPQRLFYF
eukprot:gene8167-5696_t